MELENRDNETRCYVDWTGCGLNEITIQLNQENRGSSQFLWVNVELKELKEAIEKLEKENADEEEEETEET